MVNTVISYATLALLACACVLSVVEYPCAILHMRVLGTVGALVLALLSVWWHPPPRCRSPNVYRGASAFVLVAISVLVTERAAASVPGVVDRHTVFAVYMRPLFYVLHYFLTFLIARATFESPEEGSLARAGLATILVHGLCNGAFFFIEGERFGFLYGLTLATLLIHLNERGPQSFTPRLRGTLRWPLLLFFGWALITSFTSVYPHASHEQLIRLGNWVVCFFLVFWIVRRQRQIERLLVCLLLLAGVVAGAGLLGVGAYAARAGLHKALRARLAVGNLHGNAVATFIAAFLTLGCGLLVARHQRLKGYLLPALVAVAAMSGVVGYVSRAGWENPLRACLSAAQLNWFWAICFSAAGVALAVFAVVGLRRFRSQTGILLLMVFMALCIFLTYSRSGMAGLLTGLAALFVLSSSMQRNDGIAVVSSSRKRRRTGLVLLLSVLAIAVTIGSTVVRTTPEELHIRLNIWKVALNTIRHRPIVGTGLNNHFVAAYSNVLPPEFGASLAHPATGALRDLVTSVERVGWHAHNLLIEAGETLGVVGLALLIWFVWAAFRFATRSIRTAHNLRDRYLFAALAAALVALLIPHLLVLTLSRATLLPLSFWVLSALLAALSNATKTSNGETRIRNERHGSNEVHDTVGRSWYAELALRTILLLAAVFIVGRTMIAEAITERVVDARERETAAEQRDSLGRLQHLEPWNAEICAQLAEFGSTEEKIDLYQRAVDLRSLFAPYHWKLGWSYWAAGQEHDALTAFERAIRLDPYEIDGGHYRHDTGLLYAACGRRADAIGSFVEALRLDAGAFSKPDWGISAVGVGLNPAYRPYYENNAPSNPLAGCIARHLNIKGAACAFKGTPTILLQDIVKRSLEEIDRSSSQEPSAHMLRRLVELLSRWKLYEERHEVLERLEELVPPGTRDAAKLAVERADFFARQGDMEKALGEIEHALARHESPMLRRRLGMLHVQNGRVDRAVDELERAAQAWDPSVLASASWAEAWLALGMAYERAGRPLDALRAYDMAQFLQLPIPHYLDRCLAVGRMLHASGDYAVECDVYEETLRFALSWRDGWSLDGHLIGMLARQTAACCHERGTIDGHTCSTVKQIGQGGRLWERFIQQFNREMARLGSRS